MGRPFNGRFGRQKDVNQKPITEVLIKRGFCVVDLSGCGKGIPDMLVSDQWDMCLVEVKDGEDKKLTEAQVIFWKNWYGKPLVRINSVEEALAFQMQRGGDAN